MIWGSTLLHTMINTMGTVFLLSESTTAIFLPFYLVVTIVVAMPFMVLAYRGRLIPTVADTAPTAP